MGKSRPRSVPTAFSPKAHLKLYGRVRNSGGLFGRVFSSEYCRIRETAQYMGLGPVAATPAIMNMHAVEFVGDQDAVKTMCFLS